MPVAKPVLLTIEAEWEFTPTEFFQEKPPARFTAKTAADLAAQSGSITAFLREWGLVPDLNVYVHYKGLMVPAFLKGQPVDGTTPMDDTGLPLDIPAG